MSLRASLNLSSEATEDLIKTSASNYDVYTYIYICTYIHTHYRYASVDRLLVYPISYASTNMYACTYIYMHVYAYT